MRRILLIISVFCTIVTIGCKRETSVNHTDVQVTQVSGEQSGTWSGEVHIIGDVVVPKEEALQIVAGTKVISDGYFGISVYGDLTAIGQQNSRITFTVADTTGYADFENNEAGAWRGIYFSKPGMVKFDYCDFSYGKTPRDADGGMFYVEFARNMEISNCRFHHNTARRKGAAIYAENSTMNIHDSEVYDNFTVGFEGSYTWGVGFQFLKCQLDIHDMVFHHNHGESAYGGGMNIDSCNMVLRNAVFYDNEAVNAAGLGIQRCKGYSVKVSNMLAYNNSVVHYGGGLAMATSDPELNNLTIVNNYCGGGGGAGMQMAFEAEPTLNNCIFWGNHAVYYTEDKNVKDTVEYYIGSQIWLWGSDCSPIFNNGVVQYGLDSINGYYLILPDHYNSMLEVNPLFINEQNRNYRLKSNSPCINTGINKPGMFIPDTDLVGNPRIFGGRIDMGCYEWQGNK